MIMSTHSTTLGYAPATIPADSSEGPGIFWRFFNRLIASRTAHAEAHARAYLNHRTDARLADLGFSPDRIKAVRARDGAFNSYWL
jgi:hypothetical protein